MKRLIAAVPRQHAQLLQFCDYVRLLTLIDLVTSSTNFLLFGWGGGLFSQSARETKAASHVLQTVWSYKELRNALAKDGWNKSHFQVWNQSRPLQIMSIQSVVIVRSEG